LVLIARAHPDLGLYSYYVNGTTNGCAATDTSTNVTLAGFSMDEFKACAANQSYLSICTMGPLAGRALPLKLDGKLGLAVGALLASAFLVL
jgi:hypothetical protein